MEIQHSLNDRARRLYAQDHYVSIRVIEAFWWIVAPSTKEYYRSLAKFQENSER